MLLSLPNMTTTTGGSQTHQYVKRMTSSSTARYFRFGIGIGFLMGWILRSTTIQLLQVTSTVMMDSSSNSLPSSSSSSVVVEMTTYPTTKTSSSTTTTTTIETKAKTSATASETMRSSSTMKLRKKHDNPLVQKRLLDTPTNKTATRNASDATTSKKMKLRKKHENFKLEQKRLRDLNTKHPTSSKNKAANMSSQSIIADETKQNQQQRNYTIPLFNSKGQLLRYADTKPYYYYEQNQQQNVVNDIQDFDPTANAVIVTKMHDYQAWGQLKQSLCLLTQAYNKRTKVRKNKSDGDRAEI